MVRRKKSRKPSAAGSTRPTVRVLELDGQALAEASLRFAFARAYTPETLAEHYPEGFSGCAVLRADPPPHGAANACRASVYLAHALGLLGDVRELLVVDNDPKSALTAALLHHGASLLYDDRLVRPAGGCLPQPCSGADSAYRPLLAPELLVKLDGTSGGQPRIAYDGPLEDGLYGKVACMTFFASIYEKEAALARAVDGMYASAGMDVEVEGYKTQFLYAASFGHFTEDEIAACERAHAMSYGDMRLASELVGAILPERIAQDSRTPAFTESLRRVAAVCEIWTRGMAAAIRRGDASEIAADALSMIASREPAMEDALSRWRRAGVASGARADEVVEQVVAVGLACGLDSMVEAYMAGTPMEYILEED